MFKIQLKALAFLLLIGLGFSCEPTETQLSKDVVEQEIIAQLQQAGFNTQNVFKSEFNGKSGYVVEFDIFLTADEIEEMANNPSKTFAEHYQSYNLVTGLPRVIKVGIDPAFGASVKSAFKTTIDRYNAENLQITFSEVSVTASGSGKRRTLISDADILIYSFSERPSQGFITLGRAAGFPTADGNPASGFGINKYWVDNYRPTVEDLTGVMAHEIGHTIGFRHTDYATRESCGSFDPEGTETYGAIYIPGSPTGSDATSLMQACGPATKFNANDVAALNYLY